MKRTGFSLWELIGVLALVMVAGAVLFPMFARPRNPGRRTSCSNNLRQLGIGLLQYQQDWDERLPLVAVTPDTKPDTVSAPMENWTPYGWADAIFPYVKSQQIYHCPSVPRGTAGFSINPAAAGYADYWINSGAAGLDLQKFTSPRQTILCGDGNDGGDLTDARYNLPALPAVWITNSNSPAHRHQGGASYTFVDGHAKILKPGQISTAPPAPDIYTFAIK